MSRGPAHVCTAATEGAEKVIVGDFEVALIRHSLHWWDAGTYFGVVPKTLWGQKVQTDEWNRMPSAFNCYLIRTGEHTILVETSGGDKHDERARERMKLPDEALEPLPEAMARRGFDPEAVDIVINSHLHWDHCGWNMIVKGGVARAAFPRARYFASRGEWEHAHERLARDAVSYIDANYDPLVESGQMTLLAGDCEVVPGVWMRRAPGHTRNMVIVTAESRGRTFCFFSDLVPTKHHVQPTWVMAFDLYPLESIESKSQWLGAAAEGDWVCGFSHECEVAFARIREHPKTRFEAVPLESTGG
ncbi:MAG TPA: MBL fold metallo-hydrolase [Bryobacteraceae bacterium]|jgi:glyoxylase-like metal-dependent hydrolase (beta-lactamase superfamily II)